MESYREQHMSPEDRERKRIREQAKQQTIGFFEGLVDFFVKMMIAAICFFSYGLGCVVAPIILVKIGLVCFELILKKIQGFILFKNIFLLLPKVLPPIISGVCLMLLIGMILYVSYKLLVMAETKEPCFSLRLIKTAAWTAIGCAFLSFALIPTTVAYNVIALVWPAAAASGGIFAHAGAAMVAAYCILPFTALVSSKYAIDVWYKHKVNCLFIETKPGYNATNHCYNSTSEEPASSDIAPLFSEPGTARFPGQGNVAHTVGSRQGSGVLASAAAALQRAQQPQASDASP